MRFTNVNPHGEGCCVSHSIARKQVLCVCPSAHPHPSPNRLCRFLGPDERQCVCGRSRDEELTREEKEGKTIKKKWKGSGRFPSNRFSVGPWSSAHPGEQGESESNPDSRLPFLDPPSLSLQGSWATRPHVHKEERGAKPCHQGFQQKQNW